MNQVFYYNDPKTLELLALPVINQGYINLDYEDLKSLFLGYLIEAVSVDVDSEENDRIKKLIDNLTSTLKERGTAHDPSALCLVFVLPQDAQLQMDELENINHWLDSFCNSDCEIRWGVYMADTKKLSAIIMMRNDLPFYEHAITEEDFLAYCEKKEKTVQRMEETNIRKRIKQTIEAMTAGIFEKEHIIAMALLCAIAGESVFLLGPPGTAKSLVARRLKMVFKDGKAFEYLMSRFSTPDEVFGPVSISRLKNDDVYERKVDGYLPSATVVFLDEIWKAGPAIQNALLTAVNEHIFQNGLHTLHLPMKALIAASNELPAQDEGLEALWDRFLVRLVSNCIEKESTFFKMVRQKSIASISIPEQLLIKDKEYMIWQERADNVAITDEVCNVVSDIRGLLKAEMTKEDNVPLDYYISDRRWKKVFHLMQVSAMLNGRSQTDLTDCLLLFHCIWNKDTTIEHTLDIVSESLTAGIEREISKIQKEADKFMADHTNVDRSAPSAIDTFEVVDFFYFKLENYSEGRCLCSVGEYNHVLNEKPIPGYIYYDISKRAFIVRSLGQGAKMAINVKNQKSLKQVKLVKTNGGLSIDGVPYRLSRSGANKNDTSVEQQTKSESKPMESKLNMIRYELSPRLALIKTTIEGGDNLFVSVSDLKLALKAIKSTEKRLKELEVRIQNIIMMQ